jgi:aryl-alcohol dehydrogenase-like predicted oxidoreductase
MRYRSLGGTGLSISEIGFGAWGIGGKTDAATSYGHTDDRVSLAALEEALEQGITLFDTSSVYGYGHSERLIGQAFTGKRGRVAIATKAGYLRWDQPADFSPAALRHSLDDSLRRLKTDYVDLFQLHNAPPDQLRATPEIVGTLKALVKEGKIRAWGASVRAPEDGLAMIREFDVPVLQVNFNMMDVRARDSGLLALAEEAGVGLIARTPLCFGFLSGAVTRETKFDADDHRSKWSRAQILRWIEGSEALFEAVGPQAEQSKSQIALRYCLSFSAVSTTIPGILTPAEARENAAASDLGPINPQTLQAITKIQKAQSFFAA